mgnify:FL=1
MHKACTFHAYAMRVGRGRRSCCAHRPAHRPLGRFEQNLDPLKLPYIKFHERPGRVEKADRSCQA